MAIAIGLSMALTLVGWAGLYLIYYLTNVNVDDVRLRRVKASAFYVIFGSLALSFYNSVCMTNSIIKASKPPLKMKVMIELEKGKEPRVRFIDESTPH
jgi:hypothetical protein